MVCQWFPNFCFPIWNIFFSLGAFKTFFLTFFFSGLSMICLGMVFFDLCSDWDSLRCLNLSNFFFLAYTGKFLLHYLFRYFFLFHSFLTFGGSIICILDILIVSHSSQCLFIFFLTFFSYSAVLIIFLFFFF